MSDLLRRYQAGEYEAVWDDLRALGSRVYDAPSVDDARAVARETMRRARANIETLIGRLDTIGYRFWDGVQGPRPGPPRKVTFGQRVIEGATPELLLAGMFAEARALPPAALTAVMIEQLHNVYRITVWPWQDTSQLLRGLRHPADAAAFALFEKAKKMNPAEVAATILAELDQLSSVAIDALRSAAKERGAEEVKSSTVDHRKDKKVLRPPQKKEIALLKRLEKRGFFLPLALRAWIEEVGSVNLAGSHPLLCFWEDHSFPGVYADPLMIAVDFAEIEAWTAEPDGETLTCVIGWNARSKARLTVEDEELDYGYSVALPMKTADAQLVEGAPRASLVEYLRHAFRWGGFSGWESQAKRPEAELRLLAEGLLAL
jgi:hypothetical protein